jgi:hypothetical protein
MEISAGDHVEVVNARGERSERIALTGIIPGRDFPVIRVCSLAEYDDAARESREPVGVPWPMEDVYPLSGLSR